MKVLNVVCTYCGALSKVDPDKKPYICEHCGAELSMDDTPFQDRRNAYELGMTTEEALGISTPQKKRRTALWVLGWIFIFPLPLTILLLKKENIHSAVRYGLVVLAWVLYLSIAFFGRGNASDTRSSDPSVSKSTETAEEPKRIEQIRLEQSEYDLILGENITLKVTAFPIDAQEETIMWSSSNKEVVSVNENGIVTPHQGGTATVTAITGNGVSASCQVKVDGTKRSVNVSAWQYRTDTNHIGDDWSYSFEVNDKPARGNMTISVGDILKCRAIITESDDMPDIGEATSNHTVNESEIQGDLILPLDVYVNENAGPNKGKVAHFVVTFKFS